VPVGTRAAALPNSARTRDELQGGGGRPERAPLHLLTQIQKRLSAGPCSLLLRVRKRERVELSHERVLLVHSKRLVVADRDACFST
jgi:hypothetical protein